MGRVDNRVAIVTGGGRGLGREHALHLAAEGALVVVNDLGGGVHGGGRDASTAQQVVDEIAAAGGKAVASGHDVSSWSESKELIDLAIDTFGRLDVLVNNAGIVRDKSLANMTEAEWDDVISVHLKGHAAPTRHAVEYWRARAKAGETFDASVIMTSSLAGLAGNFGQANYASAKLAVIALSRTVCVEAARFGVRSNVVSPGGRTRIAMTVAAAEEEIQASHGGDLYDPGNVSPLIVWLAAADCPATSQVLQFVANRLVVSSLPPVLHRLSKDRKWTLDDFDAELPSRLVDPLSLEAWVGD